MEIEECKQISILDVANRLGISFKQVSSRVYEHPEHDSFRIFSTTNTFKWFSRDIQEIFKVMSLILFDLLREFLLKKL